MDSANVSSLQLHSIQTSRATFCRRFLRHVCSSPRSLYVLLAALLLVLPASRGMTIPQHDSGATSKHLLHPLIAEDPVQILYYQIIAQSAEDVQNIENAPAVSMGPYLLESGQMRLLTSISVYSLRGESREQTRLLFMNA